jgi:hypothetical protein
MLSTIKSIKKRLTRIFWRNFGKRKTTPNQGYQSPYMLNPITRTWYDANDREVSEPKKYTDERTFGINDYEDFIKYLGDTKTNWNLKSKGFYDLYAKYGLKMRK